MLKINLIPNRCCALVIVLLCCTGIDTAAQNWSVKDQIAPSIDFNGVYFTSDQTGYAAGSSGAIYKTTNGGLTWVALTSNTSQTFHEIYFANNNTGYAVGANGTIRKTSNGGTTWSSLSASGTGSTTFFDAYFLTANVGYIVGSGGTIIKTTDGGSNWTTLSSGTTNDLRAVHFTSGSIGYAVGVGGTLIKTIDNGVTWSALTVATSENLNDIHFASSKIGYAVGVGGEIWKTEDAGLIWENVGTGFSLELVNVYFTDDLTGYASSDSYARITIDGGTNWIDYNLSGLPGSITGIHFSSASTGYMVGGSGTFVKYQSELEPEYQASDLVFDEVYANSMRLSYTASPDIPTGYLAIRKATSAPTTDPLDGIEYTVGQTLGDGTVVFKGNSTSFSQTALTAGVTYHYKIYAFNGSGNAINYKADQPLTGSEATYVTGAPWTELPSSSFSPSDVHFYDANNGGMAGTYFLQATSTGGQSFLNGFLGNGDVYSGIFFTSQTTGYTVGSNGNLRLIRRTVNGGATWVDQVRATSTYGLRDVWFTNATTGYAVGDGGNILKTSNGTSWTPLTSVTSAGLTAIHFPSATTGYAVGEVGTIIKTASSGASWGLLTSGIANDLNDVFFPTNDVGFAVGNGGTIIKTTDQGLTWNPQNSGTTLDLNAVHFVDALTGYVVGMEGTVLKTNNGGADWYSYPTETTSDNDLYGVYFPTPYTGYAVGTRIFKYQAVPEPVGQPSVINFSAISQNGLTISFQSATDNPDGYLVVRRVNGAPTGTPLDGVAYTVGEALGDGVVAYAGSDLSLAETSLTPGTSYSYKVFSYNTTGQAGSVNYLTTSPLAGSTLTTLTPPVVAAASAISSAQFTANWNSVAGATSYQLDVSVDGFVTLVSGYNNLTVVGTSAVVSGLLSGTTYSYRVRAVNASGPSQNSGSQSVLTVPAAPAALTPTFVTTTGFTANWSPSAGASSYLLDVSTTNFSTFVSGYNGLALTDTDFAVTGLTAGTSYQYRIRALNASGTSVNSSTVSTITICAPPVANAATAITSSSFVANWTAATGASDYRIDVSTDPSFSFIVGSYNNQTVAGTSLGVTGLNAGTSYYYRVRASNASGSSVNSSPISLLTLPASPLANDALAVASTTFTANWYPVSSATGYFIDVSTVSNFSSFVAGYNNRSVAGTSLVVTVPTAGITYYYRVRTQNGTGTSSNSNIIATLLKPAAPVATAATSVTATSFLAAWGVATGADEYSIEVSSDNFSSNIAGYDNLTVAGTSLSITDLIAGTTYRYRIRATNAAGISSYSNTIIVTLVSPAPAIASASAVSTTGFTANWAATAGAASYRLDVSTNGFTGFVSGYNNLSVASTSATVTGLSPGTIYQYRVRAVNGSGTSVNSATSSVATLPVAPTANAATAILSNGFTASWSAVAGASDYRIDVSTSGSFGSFVGSYNNQTVGGTSIAITGLTPGTTYYYRVRASNASGSSANSAAVSTLLKPSAPTAVSATAVTTTGFTANWSAMAGVSGYRLDVSLNDFVSTLPAYTDLSVSGTAQSITGLIAGTTYKYRVRSVNASGASDNSNIIATITVPPPPTASPATAVTTTGFTATWVNAGVTAYYLDVSQDNFATFLAGYNNLELSGTSQVVSGLTAGTAYKYRVRAGNVSGVSANSNTIEVTTIPLSPVANAVTSITATGFTASWSAVAGASEYRIDVSTNNSFSSYVGSYFNLQVAGTSVAVTGLTPGTFYYYRVRASNASGSSANSAIIGTLTLPEAPVANSGTSITSNTFVASWASVATATGYFIDVSTASDDFSVFVSGYENFGLTGTSTVVTVPTPGLEYRYRVRAVNQSGISSNSNTITALVKPASPAALAASSVSAESFIANWSAVPGSLGYYLDVSTNNFASFISGYDNFLLSGVSKEITGLTPGVSYQYRVRAYNATGSSNSSSTISTITICAAPVALNASSFTPTSFTANWQATVGAVDYRLDVSSDPLFAAGTFVSGYEGRTVSGTSQNVPDLVPGTVYYYRVRAVNASGTSNNSNTVSSTNIPPPPLVSSATDITAEGFSVNWATTSGAEGYFLDVSTNNFVTFVSVFNNFNVTGNSYPVSGLASGTTYQYRMRASNSSGTSLNSNTVNVITLPADPVATSANTFTTTGFTANWSAVVGASGYLLDVSSDDFSTFATGFNALQVTGTSALVTGLSEGTSYQYRVRASNESGNSGYSNTSTALTVSAPPVIGEASDITDRSFTANWVAAANATDYFIDISSDNFQTFIAGYNNKSVGGALAAVVNGLNPATAYQYRVRSANSSGISPNTPVASVTTLSAEPVEPVLTVDFSAVGTTTLTLSVTLPPATVDGYLVIRKAGSRPTDVPQDGVTYAKGNNVGEGTIAYVGNDLSFVEQDLTAGTTYFYAVYAYNGNGTTTNYLVTSAIESSQITLPDAPLLMQASAMGQNSFTINWVAATGATGYAIDVSTDDFSTFVDGFNNLVVENTTSFEASTLSGGTTYHYRVRAVNEAGQSINSETQSVLTIPDTPVNLEASIITSTSFRLSWDEVAGFDNFFVDISPDNFVTLTLNNVSIPGPTFYEFLGLSPATVYKVRLRSHNATGTSPNSADLTVTTLPAGGVAALQVSTPVFNPRMVASPIDVSVDVAGGIAPRVVQMKYRSLGATDFESIDMTLRTGSTGIYQSTITPEMSDELGVEFFVEASDATGAVKESLTHYFIYRALDATSNQAIPFAVESFNGKADTYQMFSIPYLLDDSDISDLFDPALNGQDPTRWKLLRYQNGAYAEYPEQLRKIELGQGFWFNTIETDFQIKIAQATVGQVSQSSSFQMTFEPGWNQIGNPYPFSIDWQQIKDANGDAALNSLWLFESGSYVSSGVLDPWKGAFVFSDNGGTVTFPISSKAPASGRTQNRLGNNMDAESWQLPLSLQIGSIRTVSSIGMHTEASASKDRFDEIAVPRFLDFVEMTTYHPEFFAPHFSTDVIPTTDSHHWSFEIESNLEGDAELSWDHLNLAGQQAELYLVDITNQVGINMKLTGSYKFERHANHRITMMYSREGEMDPGITLLGQAYPNPFKDHVIVPVMVEADDTTVELEVFDLVGKKVKTMQRHFATKGIYDFEWRAGDETNRIEAGLLFYRIRMNGLPTQVRRMIKVN